MQRPISLVILDSIQFMSEIAYNTSILTSLIPTQSVSFPFGKCTSPKHGGLWEQVWGYWWVQEQGRNCLWGFKSWGGGVCIIQHMAVSFWHEKWVHKSLCSHAWKVVFKLLSLMKMALKLWDPGDGKCGEEREGWNEKELLLKQPQETHEHQEVATLMNFLRISRLAVKVFFGPSQSTTVLLTHKQILILSPLKLYTSC